MSKKITTNLSEIAKNFRSTFTADTLKVSDATSLNKEIEGQVTRFLDKYEDQIYKGFVPEEDYKESTAKVAELEKSIEEKDAELKTFQDNAENNKIGLLVGKVAGKTEKIVVQEYGDEIKADGSNIDEIVKKAHEELPYTRIVKIKDFGDKKIETDENNSDDDADKKELERIRKAFATDDEDEKDDAAKAKSLIIE